MFLPLVRFRAADGTSICVAVVLLACLHSFCLTGEHTEVCRIGDSQLLRVLLGMNFMVKSGIASRIVVNVIMFHNRSFLPNQGNRLTIDSFIVFAYCIFTRNLLCLPRLKG